MTGTAPMPSRLAMRLVPETPGCAAVDVSREPDAVARRCSSVAKSRLASFERP